ncbi:MAG: hypothetical protein CMO26_09575 [Thiotrichales bacterium]|mgnify:FL=1|nr:hypothetical protein [Thiotrichales bacterium]
MTALIPLVALAAMGLIWGLQFSMLKLAVQAGYPELHVLAAALILITGIYVVLVVIKRRRFKLTRQRLVFFGLTAIMGYLIPMSATLYAAPYVPAGVLVLMASLSPAFSCATALLLRSETVSRLRALAMVLGTVAALMVLLPEAELPGHGALPWLLLALLIPLCYGIEPIYVSARWPEGLDVLQVGLGEAAAAAGLMVPILLVFGEPGTMTWGLGVAELAIAVFVIGGVFEVFLYFYLVRVTGGVLVNFGAFISLFAGIGWGMLIFAERHAVSVWLAVLVLVASLVLICIDAMRGSRASTAC